MNWMPQVPLEFSWIAVPNRQKKTNLCPLAEPLCLCCPPSDLIFFFFFCLCAYRTPSPLVLGYLGTIHQLRNAAIEPFFFFFFPQQCGPSPKKIALSIEEKKTIDCSNISRVTQQNISGARSSAPKKKKQDGNLGVGGRRLVKVGGVSMNSLILYTYKREKVKKGGWGKKIRFFAKNIPLLCSPNLSSPYRIISYHIEQISSAVVYIPYPQSPPQQTNHTFHDIYI